MSRKKKIFSLLFVFIFLFSKGFLFAGDDLDGNDDGDTDYGAGWQGGDDDDSSGTDDSWGGYDSGSDDDSSSSDDSDDTDDSDDDTGDSESSDDSGDDSSDSDSGDSASSDSSSSDDSSSDNSSEVAPGWDDFWNDSWELLESLEVDIEIFDGYGFNSGGETYATVFGADGCVYVITAEDVYDEKGNFIFNYEGPGNPEEVNARLEEIFSGQRDYPDIDSHAALSLYINARQELDAAIKSGKSVEELEELTAKVSEAREALNYTCEREGCTWALSNSGNFGAIYNAEGKTVFHAGDPVIFASGEFIIDDADISLSYRRAFFSVKRHYSSNVKTGSAFKDGMFGKGWKSNLESRIVAGFSQDFIDALPEWKDYMAKLEESERNMAEYADEDPNCLPLYEQILTLKESAGLQYEVISKYASKSEEAKANDAYVLYGGAEELAKSVGIDTFVYFQDDGSMLVFEKIDDDIFALKDGFKNCSVKFSRDGDGYCLDFISSGEKRFYSRYGLPLRYTYRRGGIVEFFYNDSMNLSRIVIDGIPSLAFFWEGGLLSSVKDLVGGRVISYTYENGLLASVRDWEGDVKSFKYDEDGIISRQVKSDGTFVFFEFSDIGGKRRTIRTVSEEGASETFKYEIEDLSTLYTNHDGVSRLYKYDERGRTVREEGADGFFTDYVYDDNNRLLSKSDNFGKVSLFYDECGNLIRKEYPDGSGESWSYCASGISSFTDRDGIRQNYFYNADNLMSDIYKGSALLLHFEYDDEGLLESSTDCHGNKSVFSYDRYGNVIEKKLYAPDKEKPSKKESWTYDTWGRIKSYVDALGRKTEYEYSPHRVEITCPSALKIEEVYSGRKLLVSKSFCDTRTGEKRCFSYEYDKCKRLTACYVWGQDAKGKSIPKVKLYECEYSPGGQIKKYVTYASLTESCRGIAREYEYQSDGGISMAKIGFYDGSEKKFLLDPLCFLHSSSYTMEGRLCTKMNEDGSLEVRFYDGAGRLLREGENAKWKNIFQYSGSGRLVRSKAGKSGFLQYDYDSISGYKSRIHEENGAVTSFSQAEYYADRNLKSTLDAYGVKKDYFYDEFKNPVRVKYPYGAVERTFDSLGRLCSEVWTDNTGKIVKEDSYHYSDFEAKHIAGGKYAQTSVLNAFGEEVALIDGYGNKKIMERDLLGRLVSESDFYGEKTYFSYDDGGNLSEITFPDGTFLSLTYDALSNCTEARDSAGLVWKKTYDSRGRLTSSSERPFFTLESYEYDEFGDICCVRRNGSVIEKKDLSPDGKTFVREDALGNKNVCVLDGYGRIVSRKNSLGFSSSMSYDDWGRPSSFTDFNGNKRTYNYSNGLLSMKMLCSDGSCFSYDYDAAGNLLRAQNNDYELVFSYDSARLLMAQTDVKNDCQVSYGHDLCKNLVSMVSDNRSCEYVWGKNAELLSVSERISQGDEVFTSGVKFLYDKVGREILRVYDSGESVNSCYDSSGRLILRFCYDSRMNIVYTEGSVYDENGAKKYSLNPDFSVTAYSYDDFGRLSQVSYPYSPEGADRMKKLCRDAGLFSLNGSEKTSLLNLSAKDYDEIQRLCSYMAIPSLHPDISSPVLTETFSYDLNNNLLSRKNPFGSIDYSYDSENRLLSWGQGCLAKYDGNGNMIFRHTALSEISYEYTATDRIKSLLVTDFLENESYERKYFYDPLNRRYLSWSDEGESVLNSYIGFTTRLFETKRLFLEERTFYSDANSRLPMTSSEKSGQGRYFFIEDETEKSEISLDTETSPYRSHPSYDAGGKIVSLFSYEKTAEGGSKALMTSESGSVKAELSSDGLCLLYDYDAFGLPLGKAGSMSFVGKTFDERSGLYDFGFRDYEPALARFSSSDPAFSGSNWYSYCDGNPVTFFDSDGLYSVATVEQLMQDMGHILLGAATNEYADEEGCLVTAIAQAITALTDLPIENSYVNSLKDCFTGGDIKWDSVCDSFGLTRATVFTETNSLSVLHTAAEIFNSLAITEEMTIKEIQSRIDYCKAYLIDDIEAFMSAYKNQLSAIEHSAKVVSALSKIEKSDLPVTVIAKVCYDMGKNTAKQTSGMHFLEIDSKVTFIDGKEYVAVTATSLNDTVRSLGSNRINSGWLIQDNRVYLPLTLIERIDTIAKAL